VQVGLYVVVMLCWFSFGFVGVLLLVMGFWYE